MERAGHAELAPNWGAGEAQYRIPKIPVAVTLVADGGYHLAGDLHLLPESGRHDGRERVLDLMLAPEPFIPVTSTGGTVIVHKPRIVLVRTGDMQDAGWVNTDLAGIPEVEAEIRLAGLPDGQDALVGTMRLAMPTGHHRLLDYLAATAAFFPVMLEDGPALVNRSFVRFLRRV